DDHEYQFRSVLVAVNHGRRVFGLRRQKRDARGNRGGASVAIHGDRLADAQLAKDRFWNEESNFHVFRRENLDDRVSGSNPLALAIESVEYQPLSRRRHLLLAEPPGGLRQRSAIRGHL